MLECLIKAGAFDSLAPGGAAEYLAWRPRLVAGLDRLLDHGGRHQKDRDQGQSGLFSDEGGGERVADTAGLPVVAPWTETEALTFEKEALGLYMSGHPLQRYAEAIAATGARRLQDLTQSEADVSIAGVVTGLASTEDQTWRPDGRLLARRRSLEGRGRSVPGSVRAVREPRGGRRDVARAG